MKLAHVILSAALLLVPLAGSAKDPVLNIIPQPESIELQKGTFKAVGASINCDAAFDARSRTAVQDFAARMSIVTGKVSSFAVPIGIAASAEAGAIKGFVFIRDARMGDEEYRIEIGKKATKVYASAYNGVLYAITTLKQMLPEAIFGTALAEEADWLLPCAVISDKPRFAYRGMHLDCSRHFFSVDAVKRYLDIMAVYKLNRFHWHSVRRLRTISR